MFHLSRFQLGLIFVSLLLLRVAVGFHFFKEGTTKLRAGQFDGTKYFFAAAKGPLVPIFNQMLDDHDGSVKLCVTTPAHDPELTAPKIDPELTYLIWDDFVDRAMSHYGFGSPELIAQIRERSAQTEQRIQSAGDELSSAEIEKLNQELAADQRNILAIEAQPRKIEQVFNNHKELLGEFLDFNSTALVSHFSAAYRLTGFDKDGDSRQKVAMFVDSLRGQVDTIGADRTKVLQGWTNEVVEIWDSLEQQVNDLAVDAQAELPKIEVHRPFDQDHSAIKVIDRVIPWFDTIVGVLLILGLFSRLASFAGAMFLLSVIATQPPFVPGAAPTYFYFIELAACLVICATAAGRCGGLDFFFSRRAQPATPTPN